MSLRRLLSLFTALAIVGCSKPKSNEATAQNVTIQRQDDLGAKAEARRGEAFVVLRNDSVIYMADMQVVGLSKRFRDSFRDFRDEWATQATKRLEPSSRSAVITEKLHALDDQINSAIASDANTVSRRLEDELRSIKDRKTMMTDALSEYRRSSSPYDNALGRLSRELVKSKDELDGISRNAVESINRLIRATSQNLPLVTNHSGEIMFKITTIRTLDFASRKELRPSMETTDEGMFSSPFLVERKPWSSGGHQGSDWSFLVFFPSHLEATKGGAALLSAYEIAKPLLRQIAILEEEISEQKRLRTDMIENWRTKYGKQEGEENVIEKQLNAADRRILEIEALLAKLKESGANVSSVYDDLIVPNIGFEPKGLKLREERRKLLEASTDEELKRINSDATSAFQRLLLKHAIFTVQTGSKGDFCIPGDVAFLFAERVRENGERFVWLIEVDDKRPEIRLSNSNADTLPKESTVLWMLSKSL